MNRPVMVTMATTRSAVKFSVATRGSADVGITWDKVIAAKKADVKPGNAMELGQMPVGTICHNIEMKPGKGGQIGRSAGAYVQLVGKDSGYAQIKLRSGELRMVPSDCMATIGAVSNPDHQNEVIGKAGRNRWKGKRPHVRGVAMNPA